jgi:hypothetical protein
MMAEKNKTADYSGMVITALAPAAAAAGLSDITDLMRAMGAIKIEQMANIIRPGCSAEDVCSVLSTIPTVDSLDYTKCLGELKKQNRFPGNFLSTLTLSRERAG